MAEKKKGKIIELKGVTKYYRLGETVVKAVDGVDVTINHGDFVAIVGPSGSGKCVTGETEILLEDGTITEIEDVGYKESPRVFGLNKKNFKISDFEVYKFHKREVDKIMSIKTSSGKEINVTEEHPFFTLDESGLTEIKAGDLKEGDFVATARKICVDGSSQYLDTFRKLSSDRSIILANSVIFIKKLLREVPFCRREICTNLGFPTGTYDSWAYKNNISLYNLSNILNFSQRDIGEYDREISLMGLTGNCSSQVVRVPLYTSSELLELYGFLAGDGNLDKAGIKITNLAPELRERIKFLVKEVFNVLTTETPKRIDINKSVIKSFFANVFEMPLVRKSWNVKLPDFVFRCSDDEIAAFIRGLFDCDSYVSDTKKEINIILASKDLVKQLRILLLRFGIHSRYSEKIKYATNTKDKIKRTYYSLSISGFDNLQAYKKKIGFNSKFKLKRLETHLKKTNVNTNVDVIPCGKFLKKLRRDSKIKLNRKIHDLLWAYEKENIRPSRDKLRKLIQLLKENGIRTEKLDLLLNSDIFWDKIISIEKIDRKTEVYDISVPGADNFVANGFIIHNSTMMNLVGALDIATRGDIFLDNVNIEHLPESVLAQIRGRKIGFIFQTFNLVPTLTAIENVMLPMMFQRVSLSARRRRARELLEEIGMGQRLNHLPKELSGGERQRVAICRALANDPEVILADEPTGNLDSKRGEEVVEMLKRFSKQGKTIIMVTHDLDMARHATKVFKLKDGKIVARR